ncbi:LysR family transcriptional regulator [uncultured Tateyamaria sp.]|uniref:LysR family transcriptional regulator n=1 Tax=uncultured Tateyamaria sp. TaxID=455651 RepID=UPI002635884B|nr:LysR family transcriptional regulator [uncultured Tateyamaria sp.]
MQDIKSIRVFLKVAELRSFAEAARALALTPASVTRIVARLEQDLGQQLFVRTTRQVALTSAGALVAARFMPVVQDFDRVAEEVGQAVRPDHGRLRLNAPLSLGVRLLPDLVSGFRLAYPNIALDISLTDAFVDIVDAPCDIAIRISGPPSDKSTIWRKICKVPRRLVAAPALFARTPRPADPSDLEPAMCLSYASDGTPETWVLQHDSGAKRTVRAGAQVISNNGDFLYALAKAGDGIALLPDFIVKDGLARREVEEVLPGWAPPQIWLTLFYPPYEALPPLVATFSDFFEAYMREVAGLDFGGVA